MARGEGPGWHRESRRHSEVQQNKRPTHAPRTSRRKEIDFSRDNPLSESEIRLMIRRINDSPQNEHGIVLDPEARALMDKAWNSPGDRGWKLTKELNAKGLAFLRRQKGVFGPREEAVLENDPEIVLIGVYQDKQPGRRAHHYPLYRVRGKQIHRGYDGERTYFDTFDYAYYDGKVHISG